MKKLFTPFLLFAALSTSAQVVHTVVLRPGPTNGVNAVLWKEPNLAGINDENLIADGWTAGGGGVTLRTLFQFSLPVLPANATLQNATLTLYGNPTTTHPQGHSSYPGAPYGTTNECWIQRVTSPWNLTTVSWTNQPSVTAANMITLQATTSKTQNYVINATQMVKDMLDTPSSAYGFMLRLQNESAYRSMIFGSSMHSDSNYRPSLVITYITPSVGVGNTQYSGSETSVYPNPATGTLNVSLNNASQSAVALHLTDVTGRRVLYNTANVAPQGKLTIDVAALPRGLYFLNISQDGKPVAGHRISLQ